MRRNMLAKRLGRSLRETVPGITWKRLPDRMLRLLVEISEAEQRQDRAQQSDRDAPPRGDDRNQR